MSFDVLSELNWPAVIVAAIAYFALGAVWYAPQAFGRAWMRSIGWDPEAEPPQVTPAAYLKPLVAFIILSIAVAMVGTATQTDTFGEGLVLGLTAGVGVGGALIFVTAAFDPKSPQPMAWAAITGGYHLVGILIVGVITSVWT